MLASVLPVPKHHYADDDLDDVDDAPLTASNAKKKFIPPYLQRENFIPVDLDDFDDGGAYPEIHVVQYPLNMGKPGVKSTAVISVNVDEKGQVQYDALVKQGQNRNKIVQSSLSDIKEKEASKDQISLPDEKEEQETAERTRQALENLLEGKIKSAKPNSVVHASEVVEPTYIRYTPNPDAPGYNPEAQQRVIRMVEAQVDPMEPPKHKHKKVPRGPPSPPVPVLHSPPRKLTVADQQAWKVPPCVSNWKNARGYTIPLDKRLAADGRGLQEVTINNKFAMLSEALYIAERKATEDLRIRNQIRKKMAMREKEDKEQELRDMAMKARMERAGVAGGGLEGRVADDEEEGEYEEVEEHSQRRDKDERDPSPPVSQRAREGRGGEDDEGREGNGGRRADRPSSRDWMGGGGDGGGTQVPSGVNPAAAQGRRGVSNLPAWMTKGLAEKNLAQTQAQARGDEKGNRDSDDGDDDRRHRGGGRDADRDAERDRDRDRSDRRRDGDDDDDRRRVRGGRGDSRDRDARPDSRSRDRDRERERERDRSPGRARKVSNLPSWMTDVTAAMRKGEIDRNSGTGKDRNGDRERDREEERDSDRRRDGSSRRDGRSVERSRGRVREASEDRDVRARGDSRDHRRRRDDDDDDRAAGSRFGRKRERDEGSDEDQRRALVTGDRDRDGRGGESAEERADRQKREQLRVERRKERERELRLENMKGAMRKKKIDRDEGRDISEKIALGMLKGTGNLTGEALFDSRLFNQSSGMDSGFAADDEYTTYSKPLFDRGEASSIYRPKRDDADVYGDADAQLAKLTDTSRFKPDKGFKGTQGVAGGSRAEPVQFENAQVREEDPFGINDIVKSKRSRHDDD